MRSPSFIARPSDAGRDAGELEQARARGENRRSGRSRKKRAHARLSIQRREATSTFGRGTRWPKIRTAEIPRKNLVGRSVILKPGDCHISATNICQRKVQACHTQLSERNLRKRSGSTEKLVDLICGGSEAYLHGVKVVCTRNVSTTSARQLASIKYWKP
jgi:hypothetical protein